MKRESAYIPDAIKRLTFLFLAIPILGLIIGSLWFKRIIVGAYRYTPV